MYVLDYGAIDLQECMGGDEAVVSAARICWRTASDKGRRDQHLLELLMAKGHGTPFEHAIMRWHVYCPIFVARQWLRHRIGSFNERSLRYTVADRVYYVPQEMTEKQREYYLSACEGAFDAYDALVDSGMKKEQARGVIPVNTYTEFLWTVNARSFMNWLDQRCRPGAQWEHRRYAISAFSIWKGVMPITAAAFESQYFLEGDEPDGS